jgi:hypothetical protein
MPVLRIGLGPPAILHIFLYSNHARRLRLENENYYIQGSLSLDLEVLTNFKNHFWIQMAVSRFTSETAERRFRK